MANYPNIDEILKDYPYLSLEGGSHTVISANVKGQDIVYKKRLDTLTAKDLFIQNAVIKKRIKTFLKKIDDSMRKYFFSKITFLDHQIPATGQELLDIESNILAKWTDREIPCMPVLEKQDNSLIYNKFNAISLKKLLANRNYPNVPYNQMLDVIYSIRKAAKSEKDTSLLHSDMYTKNFLYIFDEARTIAIDPGVKLRAMSFELSDAKVNLLFIYDLSTFQDGKKYIDTFLGTLDKDDKKLLREINLPVSRDAILYFEARRLAVNILKGTTIPRSHNQYYPQNTYNINKLIDRHI